mmetsp:Transcript_55385/g.61933  ORF Transcript_55385/g.61933 Transcript_55385/m.61933 type:complete len:80 (-) Transcript_55385:285-524(-)
MFLSYGKSVQGYWTLFELELTPRNPLVTPRVFVVDDEAGFVGVSMSGLISVVSVVSVGNNVGLNVSVGEGVGASVIVGL